MAQEVCINGARGEGGGQIIRNAVALSCVTGRPIIIDSIRHKRPKPGLRAQHVVAIKILADMCGAETEGVTVGSQRVRFAPGSMTGRHDLKYQIGTAGSITLVLQMLMPTISAAGAALRLNISGGTDVAWSPTMIYIKEVVCKAYAQMGMDCKVTRKRCGYYPDGGGIALVEIAPVGRISPAELTGPKPAKATLYCSYSGVSRTEIVSRIDGLKDSLDRHGITYDTEIAQCDAVQPGASAMVCGIGGNSMIGCDAIFDPKAQEAPARLAEEFAAVNEGVDPHLSDMMVLPAALADGITVFRTTEITKHLETSLYTASEMTGCRYGIGRTEGGFEVRIRGALKSRVKKGGQK